MSGLSFIRKTLLSLSPREALFERRGFVPIDPIVQGKLEQVIRIFIEGYNASLELDGEELAKALNANYSDQSVGFAYEGVGLYLGLLDLLLPGKKSRLNAFCTGIGARHEYIISVGAGFALARVPYGAKRLRNYMKRLDPLLAWCLADGYGFHEGIFKHQSYIDQQQEIPEVLDPELHQLFNSGIGRSLWWVKGADPKRIKPAINKFPKARRPELWCGVGLACAYAGGIRKENIPALLHAAGTYASDFLSGIPFACRMRQRGQNHSQWTSHLSEEYLNRSVDEAADWVMDIMRKALDSLPVDEMQGVRAYRIIREELIKEPYQVQITV